MARVAEDDASAASKQYSGYAKNALDSYNADSAATNNDISSLEGSGNPYTSRALVQNQNLLTSGAMNSQNMAARQQLNDAALRTGTNTAALGRTVSSNARAGQRTMDDYNAQTAINNTDKSVQLQQGLIGARQNAANSQANVFGASSGQQTAANGQLVTLNGQQDQMWGNVIAAGGQLAAAGLSGGLSAAFPGGKGT